MGMYEAKQRKEKVSRVIGGGGRMTRQRVKDKNMKYFYIQPITKEGVIQIKGYVKPYSRAYTTQIEGKGTYWTCSGSERSEDLAKKVDLYKKDILTYIGVLIQKKSDRNNADFGPHIAVAIVGDKWYISYNSDMNYDKIELKLYSYTIALIQYLKELFEQVSRKIEEDEMGKYLTSLFYEIDAQEENNDKEALYIALRWASSKRYVQIVKNEPVGNNKSRHGEINLLDYFQSKIKSSEPYKEHLRVLRIGGTLIPCYNCSCVLDSQIVIGENGYNRNISTMTNKYGIPYNKWFDKQRKGVIQKDVNQCSDNKNQNYNSLSVKLSNIFGITLKNSIEYTAPADLQSVCNEHKDLQSEAIKE